MLWRVNLIEIRFPKTFSALYLQPRDTEWKMFSEV
jgi:hypothetical protein